MALRIVGDPNHAGGPLAGSVRAGQRSIFGGAAMATIIEFRQSGMRDTFEPRRGERSGTAEIVIFPGVRVEYWEAGGEMAEEGRDEVPEQRRDG